MMLEFLWVVLLIELTPGPNMMTLAAIAAREGRRAAIAAVAGVTAGLSAYLALAVVGVGVVLAGTPLLDFLRFAGIAFLIFLALEGWFGRDNSPGFSPDARDPGGYFLRGLLINLLNAKAAILYIMLLPRFMTQESGPIWLQALILGSIHIGIATAIHTGIILGAGAAQGWLARATGSAGVRIAFTVCLLASALWLGLESFAL